VGHFNSYVAFDQDTFLRRVVESSVDGVLVQFVDGMLAQFVQPVSAQGRVRAGLGRTLPQMGRDEPAPARSVHKPSAQSLYAVGVPCNAVSMLSVQQKVTEGRTGHENAIPEAAAQNAVHGQHAHAIVRLVVRHHRWRESRHVCDGTHLAVELELAQSVVVARVVHVCGVILLRDHVTPGHLAGGSVSGFWRFTPRRVHIFVLVLIRGSNLG
jgi:hypothetical protein